jgi:hypothetical protein
MRRASFIILAFVTLSPLLACSLTKRASGTCRKDAECPSDSYCKLDEPLKYTCLQRMDGGSEGGTPLCSDTVKCPDGGFPVCDVDANTCVECLKKDDCTAPHGACDLTTRTCVGCLEKGDCAGTPSTPACDTATKTCVGCLEKIDCGGTTPACDTATKTCVGCLEKSDCSGATPVCDVPAKVCVGCLAKSDCGGAKPICEAQSCRGCKADSECADPGICMEDGHCAASTEVVYVKNDVASCSDTGSGRAGQPFCSPQPGIATLAMNRTVLLLEGPDPLDRAAFSGVAFPVLVVGKNGAVINPGSGKGLFVTGGSVVSVRTLTISGGPGSLGVQADTGSVLHIDRCLIQNNSVGGILINGASYDIENTIVAGNGGTTGYGVRIRAPLSLAKFSFGTVVNNPAATDCDQNIPVNIDNSIVVGVTGDCVLNNSATVAPPFSQVKPFHLTGSKACPNGDPASFPDHDFDGDPRTSPVDCGADQFVP